MSSISRHDLTPEVDAIWLEQNGGMHPARVDAFNKSPGAILDGMASLQGPDRFQNFSKYVKSFNDLPLDSVKKNHATEIHLSMEQLAGSQEAGGHHLAKDKQLELAKELGVMTARSLIPGYMIMTQNPGQSDLSERFATVDNLKESFSFLCLATVDDPGDQQEYKDAFHQGLNIGRGEGYDRGAPPTYEESERAAHEKSPETKINKTLTTQERAHSSPRPVTDAVASATAPIASSFSLSNRRSSQARQLPPLEGDRRGIAEARMAAYLARYKNEPSEE